MKAFTMSWTCSSHGERRNACRILLGKSLWKQPEADRGGGRGDITKRYLNETLGPTQSPVQWVPGVLSLGVKQPGCEADHSPPSSTDVKEFVELYRHSPIRLHGVVLSYKKSTGITLLFTFTSS
jgi:hypothetical protein